MTVIITAEPFDPWQALTNYKNNMPAAIQHTIGATSCFVGSMRDFNQGDSVSAMHLEHYPGMTEKQLELIVNTSIQNNQLVDALVIHRIGDIQPSDDIVLVATFSSHRQAA